MNKINRNKNFKEKIKDSLKEIKKHKPVAIV